MDDISELREGMKQVKEAVARIEACLMGSMEKPDKPGLVPEHNRCQERLIKYEAKVIELCKDVEMFKGTLKGVQIFWSVLIALVALAIKFL